jgi:hypothetical protein
LLSRKPLRKEQDPDPDPKSSGTGTDLRIRSRIKTSRIRNTGIQNVQDMVPYLPVLWIRIRQLVGLPDLDPSLFCTDPDPSINKQKIRKTLISLFL